MNFTRTTTQPPTNAPVTVTFSGLMILKPGADNTCEVGVHRWNYSHLFQVMLVVNKPDRPPAVIRLLTGSLSDPFLIRLEDDQPGNFQAYAATAGELERNEYNAEHYPLDYRWVLNLKERHYNADWNNGVKPLVTLKTGVLYTPNLTPEDLAPEYVKYEPAPPTRIPLYRFAADLAAAIVPPPDKKVRLAWTELGKPQGLTLPRPQDDDQRNTTYVVSFINEPPMTYPPDHDELKLYYDVITAGGATVPLPARWCLEYSGPQRLDEIPCMPTTIEPG